MMTLPSIELSSLAIAWCYGKDRSGTLTGQVQEAETKKEIATLMMKTSLTNVEWTRVIEMIFYFEFLWASVRCDSHWGGSCAMESNPFLENRSYLFSTTYRLKFCSSSA